MGLRLPGALPFLRRSPVFARFWAATFASQVGDAMAWIALPWFVLQSTGSATAAAGVLAALQLPAIVSGALVGSLLDRFQPRTVMAVDNVLRTLVFLAVPAFYAFGGLELWLLFLLVVMAGALEPATHVGTRVMIPELVDDDDLHHANMLLALGDGLSVVAGPLAAGILVAGLGGPFVLLLDALSFGAMAAVVASLPRVAREGTPPRRSLAERLGLRQIWRSKVLRVATLLSLVFFFSYGPLEAALPVFSERVLRTDARGFGLLWAALGVGMMAGTLLSSWLGRRLRVGVALPAIAVAWGVCLAPLTLVTDVTSAAVVLALGGFVWGPYIPLETTFLQRVVPRDQLGRVFGFRSTLLTSGAPLGIAVGGAMLAFLPSISLIGLSSAACVTVGVFGLSSRTLRRAAVPGNAPASTGGNDS